MPHAGYPQLDIKSLTLADAKVIYRRDYWNRAHCDELPHGVAFPRRVRLNLHSRIRSNGSRRSATGRSWWRARAQS
ncbi:glycosyl hydrolase 108 family protein [Comamonas guangdongensis]|uniref:Glycosyl hydrolase 108 family protein n=1 Tax=Comamonas guangdongensis TaxID=510515 RepID=A0ABV3ZPN9_9BURK